MFTRLIARLVTPLAILGLGVAVLVAAKSLGIHIPDPLGHERVDNSQPPLLSRSRSSANTTPPRATSRSSSTSRTMSSTCRTGCRAAVQSSSARAALTPMWTSRPLARGLWR